MDHIDGERAPAREDFGRTGTRAQKVGELGLRVAQVIDGIVEHIDGIETLVALDWPTPGFVALDQRDEYIELVTLLAALRRTPASVDFSELRGGMRSDRM